MNAVKRSTPVSDRTLNRLIRGAVMVLAIGIPLIVALTFLDRGGNHGPTLVERQIATAQDVVRQAPNEIGPRLALAQIYETAQRPDDALQQYDEVLKVSARDKTALLGRGDILLAKGDPGAAAQAYKKVIAAAAGGEFAGVDPQLEHAYFGLGSVAMAERRGKDAVTALEQAVKLDATDADAWYLLGTATLQTGSARRSVEALQKAVLFVPTGWCEPYTALSQAYAKLGRAASAEYAGAMVDFCQKKTSVAVSRLEKLTSSPARIDAMLGLGMIAEASGERASALLWYRKLLKTDSSNFNALSGLARLGAAQPPAHEPAPSGGSSSNATTS